MRYYLSTPMILAALLGAGSGQLAAAQFTMTGNINGTAGLSNYTAINQAGTGARTTVNVGYIPDGGFDAFDRYGYLENLGVSLRVTRNVQVFAAQNTVRWLDVFTNPTAAAITQTVRFYGDMGSNNQSQTFSNAGGVMVTTDTGTAANSDPVVAHVMGANGSGLTLSQTRTNRNGLTNNSNGANNDDYILSMTMTIGAGQSLGVLHFAALARDSLRSTPGASAAAVATRTAAFNADRLLAQTMGNNLLTNPLLTGLTQAQLNTVRNFVVPEPGTLALLGLAGAGLAVWRRHRLAHAAAV